MGQVAPITFDAAPPATTAMVAPYATVVLSRMQPMNNLEKDVQRAAPTASVWRAEYLRNAANRLDVHIDKLKAQAAEYRELAQKLDPARS